MTRHSKNATAHSTYTYHEKKKDSQKSGYGSRKRRLGAESGYQFDCCCITLQPSDDLLVSKHGILYDRTAALEYILEQRNIIDLKMKEYDNQKLKEVEDAEKFVQEKVEIKLKYIRFSAPHRSI